MSADEAIRAVREIRVEVAELRRELAEQVTTLGVVIVDETGAGRVVIGNTIGDRFGMNRVMARVASVDV